MLTTEITEYPCCSCRADPRPHDERGCTDKDCMCRQPYGLPRTMPSTASRMSPEDALVPTRDEQAARYAALNALTSAEVAAQANNAPTRVYVGTDWINVCPTEIEGVFDYKVSPQTALRLIEQWKQTLA